MQTATPEQSEPPEHRDVRPLDIEAMRKSATQTLATGATLPRHDDLQHTLLLLRGHLNLLTTETETLARALTDGDPMRAPALVTIAYARARMDAGPGCGLVSATHHTKALARLVRILCDQYATLHAAHPEQPV